MNSLVSVVKILQTLHKNRSGSRLLGKKCALLLQLPLLLLLINLCLLCNCMEDCKLSGGWAGIRAGSMAIGSAHPSQRSRRTNYRC
jgi:hypothetical protein